SGRIKPRDRSVQIIRSHLATDPSSCVAVAHRPGDVASGERINYEILLISQEVHEEFHQRFRVSGGVWFDPELFATAQVIAVRFSVSNFEHVRRNGTAIVSLKCLGNIMA